MQSKAQPDLKYNLHLEPDLKSFTFKGEVTITLPASLVKNKFLNLDARELEIFHVKRAPVHPQPVAGWIALLNLRLAKKN